MDQQRLITGFLVFLPVVHVSAFELGFLTDCTYPLAAGIVSLLVVVAVTFGWLWYNRRSFKPHDWDHSARVVVGCLCALLAWMVISQIFSPRESGFSHIGDMALLVGLALSVALIRPDSRTFLSAAGASMACMTIVSVVVTAAHGRLNVINGENLMFGIGAAPALGCLATPTLAAWAIALWCRRKDIEAPRLIEYGLCVAGITALIIFVVMDARRGPVVAVAAMVCVFVGLFAWRRSPKMTIAVVVVIGMVLASYITFKLANDPGTGREGRYLMYRTAWAVGLESFPFGNGPFGMLAADTSASPDAKMWIARESAALHPHNELLKAWVDGGVIQVALTIMLGVLLALRIGRCSDTALRPAYIALGTAWFVHAMTDNTFGVPLGMAWNGVLFGAIMTLPQVQARGVLPMPKAVLWLATGSGLLAIVTGWPSIGMAMLGKNTPMHERLTALEACRDPLFIQAEVGIIVSSPDTDVPVKALAVQMAEKRIGWTANIPRMAIAIAAAEGKKKEYLQALVRVAQRNPFDLDACTSIIDGVRRWPDLVEVIPEPIRVRCATLNGIIEPDVGIMIDGKNMETAGICLVGIHRAIITDGLTDRHREQMLLLVKYYGQIKNVAMGAMHVCSLSPSTYTARMMEYRHQISDGFGYPQMGKRALALAITKPQAESILPLVRFIYKTWFDGLEKHQAPQFSRSTNRDELETWQAVVRIWSLTQPKNH
jgi:hypothetical protein